MFVNELPLQLIDLGHIEQDVVLVSHHTVSQRNVIVIAHGKKVYSWSLCTVEHSFPV